MPSVPLAYLGLDECGSLADDTDWFTLAGVLTYRPEAVRNLIRRSAVQSGKRLRRPRHTASEFKWGNSSRRFRSDVLRRLAGADVTILGLTVKKGGRRIEDHPVNYASLVCHLLRACWSVYPNLALSLDRRFTSPTQIAVLNTFVYRHWPAPGVLSIAHVDSQRNPQVQLADFVAGSLHAWHNAGDTTWEVLKDRLRVSLVEEWSEVKRQWIRGTD